MARRRLADLQAGGARTDGATSTSSRTRTRNLPDTLRRVDNGDAALAELEGLVGDHDVQAAEARHLSDRLVCMLTRVYPAPERVLGPRLAVVMDAHPHGVALLNPPRT